MSLEWLSISLSALLSLQLGTCTTILTSRGLLPAPNTLLPSVSLVVSSPGGDELPAGLTASLPHCHIVCLSCCRYDSLPSCALRADVPSQHCAVIKHSPVFFKHLPYDGAHGWVESDTSFIRVSAKSCLACPLLLVSLPHHHHRPYTHPRLTARLLPNVLLLLPVKRWCATVLTADRQRSWLKQSHCVYLSEYSQAPRGGGGKQR